MAALSSPEQAQAVLRVASTGASGEQAATPLPAAEAASTDQQPQPVSPAAAPPASTLPEAADEPAAQLPSPASGNAHQLAVLPPAADPVTSKRPASPGKPAETEDVQLQHQQQPPVHSPSPVRSPVMQSSSAHGAPQPAERPAAASPARSVQQQSASRPASDSKQQSASDMPAMPGPRLSLSAVPRSPFASEASGQPAFSGPAEQMSALAAGQHSLVSDDPAPALSEAAARTGLSKAELLASIAAADAGISQLEAALAEQRPLAEAAAGRAVALQERIKELQVCS